MNPLDRTSTVFLPLRSRPPAFAKATAGKPSTVHRPPSSVFRSLSSVFRFVAAWVSLFQAWSAAAADNPVIIFPKDATRMEQLAAREVRRYLYLRTQQLLPLREANEISPTDDVIVVGKNDRPVVAAALSAQDSGTVSALRPEQYWIGGKLNSNNQVRVVVTGGDQVGTLYAAYRFAEHLGVRFYLHGDVVPDDPLSWRASANHEGLRTNLSSVQDSGSPLFALRGIHPFHDFPEGPDWWNREDYLGIIDQLPKLRLNFLGLHTYPEKGPNAEPTVWIGQPDDIGTNNQVHFAYPSSYQNTSRGNWGYAPSKTSAYHFGAAQLFESDNFGAEVMGDHLPAPTTPEGSRHVFEQTARLLREAFAHAHHLGVRTCVGTEIPLVVPELVQQRLRKAGLNPTNRAVIVSLYEGTFRRAIQAYPIDYYWLWTPESWNGKRKLDPEILQAATNDLAIALEAHSNVHAPFHLATCGWTVGPLFDRTALDKILPKDIAVSSLNGTLGESRVDSAFGRISGRPTWAIPWLEDDKGLTIPQLWVGRMRRDAFDARRFGCTGLLGIHWRTRPIAPTIAALAQAAWNQGGWAPNVSLGEPLRLAGPAGGWPVNIYPPPPIAGATDATVYQSAREDVSAYHIPASNGLCRVTLNFSEPLYHEAGKRIFSVKVQGQVVLERLDIFTRAGINTALDFSFENVPVTNGWVDIEFVPEVEFPIISGLSVLGENFSYQINCGGPAYQKYLSDEKKPPFPAVADFYQEWARSEFGTEVAAAAAEIFSSIDGYLPRPADWVQGPGGLRPDFRPWEEMQKGYAFVDKFAALESQVRGAGQRARFEYWNHSFAYLRTMGELACLFGDYARAANEVAGLILPAEQKSLAKRSLIPLRIRSVQLLEDIYDHLLATVSSSGELGTIMNWEQHLLPDLFAKPGIALERLLGENLPPEAQLRQNYRGPARVILLSARSSFETGEQLTSRVLVLAEAPPTSINLHWRTFGQPHFVQVPLTQLGRGVYSATWSAGTEDVEYYLKTVFPNDQTVYFPPTAPRLNQTMVVATGPTGARP